MYETNNSNESVETFKSGTELSEKVCKIRTQAAGKIKR